MLQYDPVSNLRHWPEPNMGRFGLNPYGQPLYRIVLASSRREFTFGDWEGTGNQYVRWTPKYPALTGKGFDTWVMEKWVPPEYFRCSRENWPAVNGPFPDRGDYEIAHAFESCLPDAANIEKLITWIQRSAEISQYRTFIGLRNMEDARRQAVRKVAEDMIRSKLPAFGCRPMFSGGGGQTTIRSTKNHKGPRPRRMLTAQEIGMPTQAGMRAIPTPQEPGIINGVEQRI